MPSRCALSRRRHGINIFFALDFFLYSKVRSKLAVEKLRKICSSSNSDHSYLALLYIESVFHVASGVGPLTPEPGNHGVSRVSGDPAINEVDGVMSGHLTNRVPWQTPSRVTVIFLSNYYQIGGQSRSNARPARFACSSCKMCLPGLSRPH